MREIFLGMLGLCMGTTIASGVVAFIISLGFLFTVFTAEKNKEIEYLSAND